MMDVGCSPWRYVNSGSDKSPRPRAIFRDTSSSRNWLTFVTGEKSEKKQRADHGFPSDPSHSAHSDVAFYRSTCFSDWSCFASFYSTSSIRTARGIKSVLPASFFFVFLRGFREIDGVTCRWSSFETAVLRGIWDVRWKSRPSISWFTVWQRLRHSRNYVWTFP